jgi:hypothetical protein
MQLRQGDPAIEEDINQHALFGIGLCACGVGNGGLEAIGGAFARLELEPVLLEQRIEAAAEVIGSGEG